MKFIPAPGTYIAEEITDTQEIIIDTKKTRIIKGKVIAVGVPETTDFGITIPEPVAVDDIAHFLSYEGDYDNIKVNGKRYYTVLRKDHRFVTYA